MLFFLLNYTVVLQHWEGKSKKATGRQCMLLAYKHLDLRFKILRKHKQTDPQTRTASTVAIPRQYYY